MRFIVSVSVCVGVVCFVSLRFVYDVCVGTYVPLITYDN